MLSRSGLTRLIDRLEDERLVRREPDRERRPRHVHGAHAGGLGRLRDAVPVHLEGIQRHFLDRFDAAELRTSAS